MTSHRSRSTVEMSREFSGRVFHARRDADHLQEGPHGWEIRLGQQAANRFGVELAIKRCREYLTGLFPIDRIRGDLTAAEKKGLELGVRNAIIRHDDDLYGLSYPVGADGRLWLGNHGVNPSRTVAAILKFAGL